MPLLEIVCTSNTSPQVVVDLLDLAKKIRKTPIVVRNFTGFAVNRMFFPYTQAAFLLVDRGVNLYRIDRVITEFGMPMGPFRYFLTVIDLFQRLAGDFPTTKISLTDKKYRVQTHIVL